MGQKTKVQNPQNVEVTNVHTVHDSIIWCAACGTALRITGSHFCKPCRQHFGRNAKRKEVMTEPKAASIRATPLDPRPDCFLDHDLWEALLAYALKVYGDDPDSLYGALDGARCAGASLSIANGKAKLRAGEMEDGDYEDIKARWLLPHAEQLTRVLNNPDWADRIIY